MDESKNKPDVETPMSNVETPIIDLMKKAYFDIVGKKKNKPINNWQRNRRGY